MNFVEKTIRAKQMFERYKELLPQYLNRQITTLYIVLEQEFGLSDRQIRRDIDYYMYSSLCPAEDRQAVNNILAAQPAQKPQPITIEKLADYEPVNWDAMSKWYETYHQITKSAQKITELTQFMDYTTIIKDMSHLIPSVPIKTFDTSFLEMYKKVTFPTIPNFSQPTNQKPA